MKTANDLLLSVDKGHEAVLVLLDYSAAFGTLDHVTFIQFLETDYHVTGTALQ